MLPYGRTAHIRAVIGNEKKAVNSLKSLGKILL